MNLGSPIALAFWLLLAILGAKSIIPAVRRRFDERLWCRDQRRCLRQMTARVEAKRNDDEFQQRLERFMAEECVVLDLLAREAAVAREEARAVGWVADALEEIRGLPEADPGQWMT